VRGWGERGTNPTSRARKVHVLILIDTAIRAPEETVTIRIRGRGRVLEVETILLVGTLGCAGHDVEVAVAVAAEHPVCSARATDEVTVTRVVLVVDVVVDIV
jgi:hypothetical protein